MKNAKRFLRALIGLLNPKTWGVFTETFEVTKFDAAFSISYSQGAEDIALLSILLHDTRLSSELMKTYIDVGAHDPNRFSVTRRLYDLGWFGVNIDANKELGEKFLRWRLRDEFIWAAVGEKSQYDFYSFEEAAISTSNEEWKESALAGGNRMLSKSFVPGITSNSVLLKHFPNGVGLLNIDIEGNDFEALTSLKLETLTDSQKPKWLLLETSPPVNSSLETPAVKLALKAGYIPWMVLPMGTLLKSSGN